MKGYNKMAHRKSLRQISHQKTLATNNNWMCWCYSDFTKTHGACKAV